MPTPLHPLTSPSKANRQSSLPPHVAKLYSTARWQRRRELQLRADPRCAACLREGRLIQATVADHIERATDETSFWQGALQSLCATHHASKRAAESRGTSWQPRTKSGCDAQGWPRDIAHPWNKGA